MCNSQIRCALLDVITEDAKITTDQYALLFCGRVFFKQIDHESNSAFLTPRKLIWIFFNEYQYCSSLVIRISQASIKL